MLALQPVRTVWVISLPDTELGLSARTPITIIWPHSSMSETGVRRTFTILNETIYMSIIRERKSNVDPWPYFPTKAWYWFILQYMLQLLLVKIISLAVVMYSPRSCHVHTVKQVFINSLTLKYVKILSDKHRSTTYWYKMIGCMAGRGEAYWIFIRRHAAF